MKIGWSQAIQVLFVIATLSQLSLSSSHHLNSGIIKDNWLFSYPSRQLDARFERQMPPHHEPDAILINTFGNGPSGRPREVFPGGPGVFGIPGSPGYPEGPGVPRGPGVFGMPGGPGVFGMPGGPGVFGMPGGPSYMPRGPGVFGMPGGTPHMPRGPGVFGFPGGPQQIPGPNVFGIPGGQPQMPRPDVFGMPGAPPQMPGAPSQIPGVFHISGDIPHSPREPGVFGVPEEVPQIPERPDPFEFPQNPDTSRRPGSFGIPGQLGPESVTYPFVFVRYNWQSGPMIPNRPKTFGMPGQREPPVFGVPGDPTFLRPNSGVGSGNVPFTGIPGFIVPGRIPNKPQPADEFPVTKGMEPEKFIPGGLNGVRPRVFPGVFFPDSSYSPASTESSESTEEISPRRNTFGDSGERETQDDPIADNFPIIDKSPLKSGVSE